MGGAWVRACVRAWVGGWVGGSSEWLGGCWVFQLLLSNASHDAGFFQAYAVDSAELYLYLPQPQQGACLEVNFPSIVSSLFILKYLGWLEGPAGRTIAIKVGWTGLRRFPDGLPQA